MQTKACVRSLAGSFIAIAVLACGAFSPKIPDTAPRPTAHAEMPAQDCPENLGRIVYSYDPMDRDGVHYGIYLMNPDGSSQTRISPADEIHDMEPAWAPERCRIAYKSFTQEGNDDIYVMNADGSGRRQLTTGPAWERQPDWSPDGNRIAFLSDRNGILNLFVMNADGSNVQQITQYDQDGIGAIDWSPAGDEIAFGYHSTPDDGIPPRIFGIHPDGTGLRQLVGFEGEDFAWEPAWSPDGKMLYFMRNVPGDIFIWQIDLDGSGLRQVSNWGPEYDYTHSLHMSPDGGQFAFYGVGPGIETYREEIYVINADGSGLRNVTLSPGNDQWLDW